MSKIKLSIHVPPIQKYVERKIPLDELERKYLHITQDDIHIQQLWTDLERLYCEQYVDPADMNNFAVKCLRDKDDCDLPRHLILSDVFGGESPPHVIRLIQTTVDRESSLPRHSTLRPTGATPLKRKPSVPLFHDSFGRKQHTASPPDGQLDPDRPLRSSERDGDEEDERAQSESERGQYEERNEDVDNARRQRSLEGSAHRNSSHRGREESEATDPAPPRSKSHLHKVIPATTEVPEHAPQQATFLKPPLPASRQKSAAPTYLRNPYSVEPRKQRARDSPKVCGSSRHRVEPEPYAVPETEDEGGGRPAPGRKHPDQRVPRLEQARRRSDPSAQEDDSLVTPDSLQKAGYFNGQRQAPFTTPKFTEVGKVTNSKAGVPRPHLPPQREDDIIEDASPELGADARDEINKLQHGDDGHERPNDEISEDEERADDDAIHPAQPKLRTPFNSFSAKQRPKQQQKPSPRPSTKKLKPIKSRLLDTARMPAGAADAHARLQSATKGRTTNGEDALHAEQGSDEEEDEAQRPETSGQQRSARPHTQPSLQVPATSQVGPRSVTDTVPDTYVIESTQKITQSPYGSQKARDKALRQEGRELYRAYVRRRKELASKSNQSAESDHQKVNSRISPSKPTTAGLMIEVQMSGSDSEHEPQATAAHKDRAGAEAASQRAHRYSEDYARRSASRNLPSSSSRPNHKLPAKHTATEIFEGLFEPPETESPRKKKKAAVNSSLSSVFRATTQPLDRSDAHPDSASRAKSAAPSAIGLSTSFSRYKGSERTNGVGEASSSTGVKRKRASEPSEDLSSKKQAKLAEIKKEHGGKQKSVIPNHMLHDDPITVTDSDVASSIGKVTKKRSKQPASTEPKTEACEICRKAKRRCEKLPQRSDGACAPCIKRHFSCPLAKGRELQDNADQRQSSKTAPAVQRNSSDPRPASSSRVSVIIPTAQKRQKSPRQDDGIEETSSEEQHGNEQTPATSFPFPSSQPRNSQRLPSSPPVDHAAFAPRSKTPKSRAKPREADQAVHVVEDRNEEANGDEPSASSPEEEDNPNEQLENEKLLGAWNKMTEKRHRQPTPARSSQVPSSSKRKPGSSKSKRSVSRVEEESDSGMEGLPYNPQAPQHAKGIHKPSSSLTKAKYVAEAKKRDQPQEDQDSDSDSSESTSTGTHSSQDGVTLQQMENEQQAAEPKHGAAITRPSEPSSTSSQSKPKSSTPKPTMPTSTSQKPKANSTTNTTTPTSSDSMDEYSSMDERADDILTDEQKKRLAQVPPENRRRERMYMIGKSASSSERPQPEERTPSPVCAAATSSAPSAGWLSSAMKPVRLAAGWLQKDDPWWREAQEEARTRANA